jgi:ABC-2 type transport system ATP-binding protein
MTSAPLSLTSVSKSFAGKLAVKDVSMRVERGEIVGFLGPNGAGKTTKLRMALGLIKPDSGEALLFGGAPGPAAFGRLGFLPEERGLYRKSTARASIAHMARLNGMSGKAAYARADEMMDKYGLSDAKTKKVKALSKGMAQKVQLIAAIAHDPEFLILDEPFSGLDPVNQKILEGMVREIAQRGRTIIFSTHVMEHAERLCDRIVLMARGEKIFDGSTKAALGHAARRLLLEVDDMNAQGWLNSFAKTIETDAPGLYRLTLKDAAKSQDVLEACVARKTILRRFEPERATLHDAFVNLVGGEAIAAAMTTQQEDTP